MISLPEISTLLHLLLLRGANNTSPPISDPSHYGHRARMELQHRDHRHQWCHHAACPHETRFESLTWTHHTVFHQVRRGVREVPTDRRHRAPGPSRCCSRCRCCCVKWLYQRPHRKCQEVASKIKLPVSCFSHRLAWPLDNSRDVLRRSSALTWLFDQIRVFIFKS